jgi:hypothetical protein
MVKIQKSTSEKITKGISKALIRSRAEAERGPSVELKFMERIAYWDSRNPWKKKLNS